jgi:hypothetical protein
LAAIATFTALSGESTGGISGTAVVLIRLYRRRFCFRNLTDSIEGIEIIPGIAAICAALASFVARKKSSAGCFFGRDFAVSEVVCII